MAKKKTEDKEYATNSTFEGQMADSEAVAITEQEPEPPKDPAYYFLHEDGRKIACAASELEQNERQVADLNGRLYYHCGELNGKWTYREE
jgi:hypothetical protein